MRTAIFATVLILGFLGVKGQQSDSSAIAEPVCPPDKPIVQCVMAPCQMAHCDSYPNATCVNDYCGGCNARFFIEVTDTCKL